MFSLQVKPIQNPHNGGCQSFLFAGTPKRPWGNRAFLGYLKHT
jgi:hypothetical protein